MFDVVICLKVLPSYFLGILTRIHNSINQILLLACLKTSYNYQRIDIQQKRYPDLFVVVCLFVCFVSVTSSTASF